MPAPADPPHGHFLVDLHSAGINHGDKSFLADPAAAGSRALDRAFGIWGASASGVVSACGPDLSADLIGRGVAIYRSLSKSAETVGLWSEKILVERTSCVVLPGGASPLDYSASLVNMMTAYAFLEQVAADHHKGVVVTAANSATGLAVAALARRRGVPAIFLTRTNGVATTLRSVGIENVLVASDEDFHTNLASLAAKLETTAVFDGVGGDITSRIMPSLPAYTTIYLYGFLGADAPIVVPSRVLMSKNLVLRRFSNFASPTVSDPDRLATAIAYLESAGDDPLFHTRVGREFAFDDINAAMDYQGISGAKAVLRP